MSIPGYMFNVIRSKSCGSLQSSWVTATALIFVTEKKNGRVRFMLRTTTKSGSMVASVNLSPVLCCSSVDGSPLTTARQSSCDIGDVVKT
jgi:hypothetical protein